MEAITTASGIVHQYVQFYNKNARQRYNEVLPQEGGTVRLMVSAGAGECDGEGVTEITESTVDGSTSDDEGPFTNSGVEEFLDLDWKDMSRIRQTMFVCRNTSQDRRVNSKNFREISIYCPKLAWKVDSHKVS